MIPKVKFSVIDFDSMMPLLCGLLSDNHPWSWSILHEYPKLEKVLTGVKNNKKRRVIINEYFKREFKINYNKLVRVSKSFQRSWDKINDSLMTALSEVVEVNWCSNLSIINARVSMNKICPRTLSKKTFDMYYKYPAEEMKSTCIHELLHFIYFTKWKQVFPKMHGREFNPPYLAWKLSEMVPKSILSDKRIQKIFSHDPHIYDEYKKMTIGGRPLLDQLDEIYSSRTDFSDFLRKSYAFVKKHRKVINDQFA